MAGKQTFGSLLETSRTRLKRAKQTCTQSMLTHVRRVEGQSLGSFSNRDARRTTSVVPLVTSPHFNGHKQLWHVTRAGVRDLSNHTQLNAIQSNRPGKNELKNFYCTTPHNQTSHNHCECTDYIYCFFHLPAQLKTIFKATNMLKLKMID